MDELGIDDYNYRENEYSVDGLTYKVTDIIELSKQYKPFDMPICGIDISVMPWGEQTIKKYCYHIRRIENANLDYPIVLDDSGFICDGWHRLVKAIIKGQKSIKAIRLKVMPDAINKN